MKHIMLWVFVLIASPLASQKPVWEWAITTGGPGKSFFNGVNASPDGYIYVTGGYGDGFITFGADTLQPCGVQWADVFMAKMNSSGNVLWVKTYCGYGHEFGNQLAFDKGGNLYLTGVFTSPYLVFGSDTLFNLPGAASPDYGYQFLVKLDSAGNYHWGKVIGGMRLMGYYIDVALDHEDNLLVSGIFTTPYVVFGSDTLINMGNTDLFLAKYDTNGNLLWARSAGGVGYEGSNSIDIDETGHVLFTGFFSSYIAWFDTVAMLNPATTGSGILQSFFLAKYDPAGHLVWVKAEGGPGSSGGAQVVAHPTGGSVVAGGVIAPSGLIGNVVLSPLGESCAFFARHDPSGNVQWVQSVGGTLSISKDGGTNVAVDKNGDIIAAGSYYGPALIIGMDTLQNANYLQGYDIFIVKYNASGIPQWAASVAGSGNEHIKDLCVNFSMSTYIAGLYGCQMLIIGQDTLVNNQQQKGYIAKLTETTDIDDPKIILPEIQAYPNPFTDQVVVVLPKELPEVAWELYDLHGRLLFHGKLLETDRIWLHDLPAGVYVLSLADQEMVMTQKLIKTR